VDNYSAKMGVVQRCMWADGYARPAYRKEYDQSVTDGINHTEQEVVFAVERAFYVVLLAGEDLGWRTMPWSCRTKSGGSEIQI
jgi:hypothetical protein